MAKMKELREALNMTQADLARLAGTSQPQIMRLEKADRKLTKQWAERIAPHLQVSARDLMFEEPKMQMEVTGLPVVGASRAGDWLDITMIDDDEYETIPVARHPRFPHAKQYALHVLGDSMNRIFADGTYVTCVDFADSGLSLKPGMIVHVERTLSGRQLVETTVKKVGDGVLLPQSTNPVHSPIKLDGEEDTEILVKGVVIGKWEPIGYEGFED